MAAFLTSSNLTEHEIIRAKRQG